MECRKIVCQCELTEGSSVVESGPESDVECSNETESTPSTQITTLNDGLESESSVAMEESQLQSKSHFDYYSLILKTIRTLVEAARNLKAQLEKLLMKGREALQNDERIHVIWEHLWKQFEFLVKENRMIADADLSRKYRDLLHALKNDLKAIEHILHTYFGTSKKSGTTSEEKSSTTESVSFTPSSDSSEQGYKDDQSSSHEESQELYAGMGALPKAGPRFGGSKRQSQEDLCIAPNPSESRNTWLLPKNVEKAGIDKTAYGERPSSNEQEDQKRKCKMAVVGGKMERNMKKKNDGNLREKAEEASPNVGSVGEENRGPERGRAEVAWANQSYAENKPTGEDKTPVEEERKPDEPMVVDTSAVSVGEERNIKPELKALQGVSPVKISVQHQVQAAVYGGGVPVSISLGSSLTKSVTQMSCRNDTFLSVGSKVHLTRKFPSHIEGPLPADKSKQPVDKNPNERSSRSQMTQTDSKELQQTETLQDEISSELCSGSESAKSVVSSSCLKTEPHPKEQDSCHPEYYNMERVVDKVIETMSKMISMIDTMEAAAKGLQTELKKANEDLLVSTDGIERDLKNLSLDDE